jgi:hypothetical protein
MTAQIMMDSFQVIHQSQCLKIGKYVIWYIATMMMIMMWMAYGCLGFESKKRTIN